MTRRFSWRRSAQTLAAGALAAALTGGVARAGHPPATTPEPLGAATHRFFDAQAAVAGQDRFVIYEIEWRGDTAELGPYGRSHLAQIIRELPTVSYPVILELHPKESLNHTRRDLVVNALLRAGIGDAPARVVLGGSIAEGLYGEEAVPLYPMLLTARYRFGGMYGGFGGMYGGFGGLGGFGAFGGLGGLGGLWGGGGYGLGGLGLGAYGLWGYGMGGYGGYGATPAQGFRGLGY